MWKVLSTLNPYSINGESAMACLAVYLVHIPRRTSIYLEGVGEKREACLACFGCRLPKDLQIKKHGYNVQCGNLSKAVAAANYDTQGIELIGYIKSFISLPPVHFRLSWEHCCHMEFVVRCLCKALKGLLAGFKQASSSITKCSCVNDVHPDSSIRIVHL